MLSFYICCFNVFIIEMLCLAKLINNRVYSFYGYGEAFNKEIAETSRGFWVWDIRRFLVERVFDMLLFYEIWVF